MVLAISALAIPHKAPALDTNGTSDTAVALGRNTIDKAVEKLKGRGQVRVYTHGTFATFQLSGSLILALDTAGVDVCVLDSLVAQYGEKRRCKPGGPDVDVIVESAVFPPNPGEEVLAEASTVPDAEKKELAKLSQRVAAWLKTQSKIRVTPSVHKKIADYFGDQTAKSGEEKVLSSNGLDLPTLVFSSDFAGFINSRSEVRPDGTVVPAIETGSFPAKDLVRWAHLVTTIYNGRTVRIAVQPEVMPLRASATTPTTWCRRRLYAGRFGGIRPPKLPRTRSVLATARGASAPRRAADPCGVARGCS